MRKVTKILGKIIASIILIIIILPLTCSILLTIEPVQSFAVRRAADLASAYLGTEVEVKSARLNFFTTFELGGVEVEDFQDKKMISIESLELDISALSILKGKISLDGVEASGVELNVREVEPNVLNITQVLELLLKSDNENQTAVELQNIRLNNMNISYERLIKSKPESGIDLTDIHLESIYAHIASINSDQGVTSIDVAFLSGRERSGFKISNFNSLITIAMGAVELNKFNFETPNSSLHIPFMSLSAESWEKYKDFASAVDLDGKVQNSTIAMQDIAYFMPALKGNTFALRNITTELKGTLNDIKTDISSLRFAENGSIKGTVGVLGLPDINNAEVVANVDLLKFTSQDVEEVIRNFNISELPSNTRNLLSRAGIINITGRVEGTMERLAIDSKIESTPGGAQYQGTLGFVGKGITTNGVLSLNKMNIGTLLARSDIGEVTLQTKLNGTLNGKYIEAATKGKIDGAYYNAYNYSNIDFDAKYSNNKLKAEVISHDKNLDFELSGSANLAAATRTYSANLRLAKADLTKLNFNRKDSISKISGSMKLDLTGNDIENLSGKVLLRNLSYTKNEETLTSASASIKGNNTLHDKNTIIDTEWFYVSFNSKNSYKETMDYLKDGLHRYLPILYANDIKKAKSGETIDISNNYSTLKIVIKDFSPISENILDGFTVADSTTFKAVINPYDDKLSMRLTSKYIEYKKSMAATDLNININNNRDSLSLYTVAKNIYLGLTSFSSFSLMAGARNNNLEFSAGIRDTVNKTTATLGAHVMFDSLKRAHIQFLPSQFKRKDNNWFIHSKGIVASKERIDIDNFSIRNKDQSLDINGTLSKSESDTVSLKLKDYNIGLLSALVSQMGYNIDGVSNGYITATSALNEPRIEANVDIDSARANQFMAPPLKLHAAWNATQNIVGVSLTMPEKQDTVVKGYYKPSDRTYFAHFKTDSLNAGLIDPILSTTITGTRGYAKADVKFYGAGQRVNAVGVADLTDVSTKIIFTNVRYKTKNTHIDIKDNMVTCKNCEVFDKDGNSGLLTLDLNLDRTTNVKYNMRMTPKDMLVLNTTLKDNELFYGTLYASGVATIKGDKRIIDMNLTGESSGNSSFCMPLQWQSTVAKTDFIEFSKKEQLSQLSAQDRNYRRNMLDQRLKRSNTSSSSLNVNLSLHATPDVDFSIVIDPVVGDIIRARGDGRFNMQIRPSENVFEMYGDYAITEGSYDFMLLNPIIKKFIVEPGTSSMQWSGDPINPTLNIDVKYKTKTSLEPLLSSTAADNNSSRSVPVDCIIHLRDRLMQPAVSFDIDVPTASLEQQAVIANSLVDQETISRQFFYLMFANSFIPINSNLSNEFSSTASVANGFDLLTNQLSNWLSSSNLNWVIRYRPQSELTSDEIDLGFSRGLIDNRLLIEVEGNYLADNKTAINQKSASNFMGEAYITWLIDKAGTLKLKGFTQTIDDYDENQGMQETGVGVYYQESFDKWKDLPSQIKERFKSEKNLEEDITSP